MGIVDSVNRELPRVFGGVAPEHLDVACGASVLLCFLQALDLLHTQVTLEPLGGVNLLVCLELTSDVFMCCGLDIGWRGWAVRFCWRAASRQLVEIPYAELPTSTDFPYFIRKSNKNTEVRIGVEKYAFWKIP